MESCNSKKLVSSSDALSFGEGWGEAILRMTFSCAFPLCLLLFFSIHIATLNSQTPEIVVQTGHGINPTVVTFSSDGKLLATGGKDKQIKIWDAESGQLLRTINAYDAINDLAFYPDNNKYLASASSGKNTDYALYSWNTFEGGYSDSDTVSGGINNAFFTSNGSLLVTTHINGPLSFWIPGEDDGTYDLYQTIGAEWEEQGLKDIAVTINPEVSQLVMASSVADSFYLASAMIAYDSTRPDATWTINVSYHVRKLQFTGDNKYVIALEEVSSSKKEIVVIEALSGNVMAEFEAAQFCLNHPEGTIIFTDLNGVIKTFDLATMQLAKTIIDDKRKYNIVAVSPAGDRLAAIEQSGNMRIWQYPSGKMISETQNIPPRNNVLFDPLGRFVVFDGKDGQLVRWEMESGSIKLTKPHHAAIEHIAISDDGKWLATAALDSTVKMFDLDNDSLYSEIKISTPHINSIDINSSGTYMSVTFLDSFFNYKIYDDTIIDWYGSDQELNYYGIGDGDTVFFYLYDKHLFYVQDASGNFLVSLDYGEPVEKPVLSPGNKYYAFISNDDSLKLFETATGNTFTPFVHNHESITALAFSPGNEFLYIGHGTGYINTRNLETETWGTQLVGHNDAVRSLSYYNEKNILASSGNDGTIALWDLNYMSRIATLYAFDDGSWAVVDAEGRYDASNGGIIESMHFVYELEVIDLYQLKERYYEPGLLQKLLGYNDEPLRDVSVFNNLELYPEVTASMSAAGEPELSLSLVKRTGGFGRIQVFINNKEVIEDAGKGKIDESLDTVSLSISLKAYANYFIADKENEVAVKVFNEEGYLSSRYYSLKYLYKPQAVKVNFRNPKLFVLSVGTSNYRGTKLDLKYADKDADNFASAMKMSGSALLGETSVTVKLLNTSATDTTLLPRKNNIKKALADFAAKAQAQDVMLLYLSGHGVNYGEEGFYYLTQGVESGDLKDDVIRKQYAVSTTELTEWLKLIPAQKQVMIIDACSSGKLVEDLLAMKAVSSSQIRAIERMKDRTGTFIIAGSAADMVSYEASQFGQSLLTYSLLLGMSGASLRENEFVDVMTLFQYASDRVPEFARYVGGVQKPVVFAPYQSNSFDIGRVTKDVHIPVASIKPVFVRSNFQQENLPYDDVLALSESLNSRFSDITSKGADASLVYVDTKTYPSGYYITGRYSITDGKIILRGGLLQIGESGASKQVGEPFTVERPESQVSLLVDDILEKVQELVK